MTSETVAQELRAKIADQVANKGKRKTTKKVWVAPVLEDFAHGRVLALDQTLTKTGFSVVTRDHEGLHILEGNMLIPETRSDLKGFELTFAKAASLGNGLDALMLMMSATVDVIVHEMPSVHGYRIESSLMAAREVRRAALGYARGVPVVAISNLSMRAMLNPPNERLGKKYVKSAVEALISDYHRAPKRWNEDVCDSVGLALTYLYQKGKP
jgi:hypothetical protein